jgi:hypothetical protein
MDKKDKYCIIHLHEVSTTGKFMWNKIEVTRDWKEEERGSFSWDGEYSF